MVPREYPRLRFRDGGYLDLEQRIPDWERAAFEAKWRAAGVGVEWLRSYRGRLDAALDEAERYVTPSSEQDR